MSEPSGPSADRLLVSPVAPLLGGLAVALVGDLLRLLAVHVDHGWLLHLGTWVVVLGLAVTGVGVIALGVSLGLRDAGRGPSGPDRP